MIFCYEIVYENIQNYFVILSRYIYEILAIHMDHFTAFRIILPENKRARSI